jgi:hypothetical protein
VRPALALLCCGCATVVPMQTASTVDEGHWRVGGQVGVSGYCGSFTEGPLVCTEYPDGVPLPELRLDARRGIRAGFDVGVSAQLWGQALAVSKPVQVGLTIDAKHVLLDADRHVVSLGLLLGTAVSGRPGLRAYAQGEGGVQLIYGFRTARFEWVAGAQYSERRTFQVIAGDRSQHVGFTLGVFRQRPAGWALQLGYLGDPRRFGDGAIQIQYGVFWDR